VNYLKNILASGRTIWEFNNRVFLVLFKSKGMLIMSKLEELKSFVQANITRMM